MESTEKPQQHGGITNYFQGATINNLVINGNMVKSGSEQFHNDNATHHKTITNTQIIAALQQCGKYIWGNAAYSIAFCVCRDIYHMGDNASQFERLLNEKGILLPAGTINTAMSRNQWMKYHVDNWEENGASERALKLRDAFKEQVETLLINAKKTA